MVRPPLSTDAIMSSRLKESEAILETMKTWVEEVEDMADNDFRELREEYDRLQSAIEDLIFAKESVIEDEKQRVEKRKKRKKNVVKSSG